jgi:hypothetical protein
MNIITQTLFKKVYFSPGLVPKKWTEAKKFVWELPDVKFKKKPQPEKEKCLGWKAKSYADSIFKNCMINCMKAYRKF